MTMSSTVSLSVPPQRSLRRLIISIYTHVHLVKVKPFRACTFVNRCNLPLSRSQVDLDIAGTENSLLHTFTELEKVHQPWFNDDWGQEVIQQRIHRKFVENEDDARLVYPTNAQGGYALVNRDVFNSWGSPRGYAVHPGYSPMRGVSLPQRYFESRGLIRGAANRRSWARSVSLRTRTGRGITSLSLCERRTSLAHPACGTSTCLVSAFPQPFQRRKVDPHCFQ